MKPPDVTRKRRKQQPKPSTSERDCTPSTAVEERLHALDGGKDGGKRLATGEEQPRQAPPRDERKEEAAPEAEQQRERRHALDAGNGEPGGSKVDETMSGGPWWLLQAIPWYDAARRRLLVEKVAKGASNGELGGSASR